MNATPLPPKHDRSPDERTNLLQFLELYRTVARRKAEGLTQAQMNRTVGASPLTIASITKHLAFVENVWFVFRFAGEAFEEPWSSAPLADDPDWDLNSATEDSPAELLALYDAACARSRTIVDRASLDDQGVIPDQDGDSVSLRWMLLHLVEEYARHVGHLDFLRETVDGSVGD
jgi:hypothetical protein